MPRALDLILTKLKLLELVQRGFYLLLVGARGSPIDPVPALQQKFLLRPVGFQIEGRDDPTPEKDWATEVAIDPFMLGNVSLEAILVVEEEAESLALDDQ